MTILAASCAVAEHEVRSSIRQTLDTERYTESDHLAAAIREFYENRAMRPIWTDGGGVSGRGKQLLEVLESAGLAGLNPERYGLHAIEALRAEIDAAPHDADAAVRLGQLDVSLTAGYSQYLHDLDVGALEANPDAADRPAGRVAADLVPLLDAAAGAEGPAQAAQALEPATPAYMHLKSALAHYAGIAAAGGWPEVMAGSGIAPATTARTLRQRLIAESNPRELALADHGKETPDQFDDHLKAALQHFQRRHGLAETGTLDAATLFELNTSAHERIASISLNLDRLRAMPRDSATLRIVVNVPAYEMSVIDARDEDILGMRVVVGGVNHQTPVMIDTMEYVVTNPYWHVPASILAAEILPAAIEDENYLQTHDMEIVGQDDQVIDANSIDWDDVDPDSVQWTVRQRPGAGNALGRVKFRFPNTRNIYLHDTPSRSGFAQTSRALSHGCIRLEQPLELARLVLDRRTESAAVDLDDLLDDAEEDHIPLTRGMPVHILYLTAVAEENGDVRFLKDVYGKDAALREQVVARLNASPIAVAPLAAR